jgi:1-pyrroline-5-carboxylate dehydrogenase
LNSYSENPYGDVVEAGDLAFMTIATKKVETHSQEFRNEPFLDFSQPGNRQAMEAALNKLSLQQGREYPIQCGDRQIFTDQKVHSTNPSHPERIVGTFQDGTVEIANQCVESACNGFQEWKLVPAEERVACLQRAAEIFRARRYELNALLCNEVGKGWEEADAEIAELIDFAEFYGQSMLRLSMPRKLTPLPGERNHLRYIPLGVGIVIPPWNFPASTMGGMTLASIVTGNAVVLKPSPESPTIAAVFMDILHEAGVPRNVANFFTGPGETAGEAMVIHPKTRFVAFTGSKRSGLRIHEQASKHRPDQLWIKRTVLEMGGKDAIIVDEDADLNTAVEGVALAAFGYAGQKCSACSRAIVTEKVYDQFLEKLVLRVKSIKVGPAEDPSNFMGPVISKNSMKNTLNYIEIGRKEGRLLTGGAPAGGDGYFIEPTVIADVNPKARIAQEEIFGPVLAVVKARDFNEAIAIGNDTEYGLTGAVYSSDRTKLEKASELFYVGNLYLNRKCTGAMVGVHPFGGFNMSGTDSKSGGEDYLLHFLQGKTITEKVAEN